MLAKSVKDVPEGDYLYEPKWDGFRCLAFRAGTKVELRAKSGKPLGRYFPEVVALLAALPPERFEEVKAKYQERMASEEPTEEEQLEFEAMMTKLTAPDAETAPTDQGGGDRVRTAEGGVVAGLGTGLGLRRLGDGAQHRGGDPELVIDDGRLIVRTPTDGRIVIVQADGTTSTVDISAADVPSSVEAGLSGSSRLARPASFLRWREQHDRRAATRPGLVDLHRLSRRWRR